jgi:YVTN family beta-propeller protein
MQSRKCKRLLAFFGRGEFAVLSATLVLFMAVSAGPAEGAGPFAYVANTGDNTVSVIATATNTVVGSPIAVGMAPQGVAVTPDGTKVYVANQGAANVSVIATATNTVVGSPIAVGSQPLGIAVTPDGTKVYVTNVFSDNVSVIASATNTVVGSPIPVGSEPTYVGSIPPPPFVPFSAFSGKLQITFGSSPNTDTFDLNAKFTLGSNQGINPPAVPVTLRVGTYYTVTIPKGSFKGSLPGPVHLPRGD